MITTQKICWAIVALILLALFCVVIGACAKQPNGSESVNCELIAEAESLACVIAETVCEVVEDCEEEIVRQIDCERLVDAQYRLCKVAQGEEIESSENPAPLETG